MGDGWEAIKIEIALLLKIEQNSNGRNREQLQGSREQGRKLILQDDSSERGDHREDKPQYV